MDHLVELARAKQEIEAMMLEVNQLPKEEKIAMGQENPSADVKKPSPSKARRKRAKKKSKQPPTPPPTKTHQQGIIPNPITVCHHCYEIGHIRLLGQEYERHGTRENFKHRENYRHVRKVWVEKSRNRRSPPRIRKIWVRKDLVNQMRNKGKETMGKSSTFV